MPRSTLSWLRRNAVGFAALFVALGGTSYAVTSHSSFVGSSGKLSACVNRSSGKVRLIKGGSSCHKRREQAVSWNQQGADGSNGSQGAQGQVGATGVQGPASLALSHFAAVSGSNTLTGVMHTMTSANVTAAGGELLVNATVNVVNFAATSATVSCEVGEGSSASPGTLTVVGSASGNLADNTASGGWSQTIPINTEFLPAGTDNLVLACSTTGTDAREEAATLSAVSVLAPS
jgi:hypothetical protein